MLNEIWKDRWDIVERQIIRLQELLTNSGDFPRKESLVALVNCFRDFAEQQLDYFYKGFSDRGDLVPSKEYPPENTVIVTLQQIAFDLEVLQRAVDQRLYGNSDMQWALDVADTLAWQALEFFSRQQREGKITVSENMTVITYFQKFAEIRMIPYASVALIGLPMTCIRLPFDGAAPVIRDFLAIPHEVGHYLYWHGEVDGKRVHDYLQEQLRGRLTWGEEWLEEVFADVLGCFVAGPAIAQSFQDLQLQVPLENFYKDDGEHPASVLRPDIYTKVLRKVCSKEWAIQLNSLWITARSEREAGKINHTKRMFRYRAHQDEKRVSDTVTLTDSFDDPLIDSSGDGPVDIMVKYILDAIGLGYNGVNWWHSYFSKDNSTKADPYELFETKFRESFLENSHTLSKPKSDIFCKNLQVLRRDWEQIGKTNLKKIRRDEVIRSGKTAKEADEEAIAAIESAVKASEVWLPVFIASGWTTRGPVDNPTPPG